MSFKLSVEVQQTSKDVYDYLSGFMTVDPGQFRHGLQLNRYMSEQNPA